MQKDIPSNHADQWSWPQLIKYQSNQWSPTSLRPWGIGARVDRERHQAVNSWGWRSFFEYGNLSAQMVEQSVLLFGCSCIWGEGIKQYDQTLAYQLSSLLNRPVINLAIPGTGPEFAQDQAVRWLSNYPKPWAVVHGWSHYTRWSHYSNDLTVQRSLGQIRVEDTGWDLLRRLALQRALWDVLWAGSLQSNFTFFADVQVMMGWTPDRFIVYKDLASDLKHPGAETIRLLARSIADELEGPGWSWHTDPALHMADPTRPETLRHE